MSNNKNEVISVLPIKNFNGGYMKKTYNELIEDISPEEIDELYCYLEELKEKYMSKDA
jgi:N-acetylneuraminic acid mutarotase